MHGIFAFGESAQGMGKNKLVKNGGLREWEFQSEVLRRVM